MTPTATQETKSRSLQSSSNHGRAWYLRTAHGTWQTNDNNQSADVCASACWHTYMLTPGDRVGMLCVRAPCLQLPTIAVVIDVWERKCTHKIQHTPGGMARCRIEHRTRARTHTCSKVRYRLQYSTHRGVGMTRCRIEHWTRAHTHAARHGVGCDAASSLTRTLCSCLGTLRLLQCPGRRTCTSNGMAHQHTSKCTTRVCQQTIVVASPSRPSRVVVDAQPFQKPYTSTVSAFLGHTCNETILSRVGLQGSKNGEKSCTLCSHRRI